MNYYILAGGQSKRMGRNKALLEVDGLTVIERVVLSIPAQRECIRLVTNTPGDYDFLALATIADIYRDIGPLAGVHAALLDSSAPASFILACDLPFISTAVIERILSHCTNQDIVAARTAHGTEPLCAAYSRVCLPVIEAQIQNREYSLRRLLTNVETEFVELPEDRALFNLNTPEDLRRIT